MIKYCITWDEPASGNSSDVGTKLAAFLNNKVVKIKFHTTNALTFEDVQNGDILTWKNILTPSLKDTTYYMCKVPKDDDCKFIEVS
jgi:hypothetical protein